MVGTGGWAAALHQLQTANAATQPPRPPTTYGPLCLHAQPAMHACTEALCLPLPRPRPLQAEAAVQLGCTTRA